MVKLIGVNKGRQVTLRYFIIGYLNIPNEMQNNQIDFSPMFVILINFNVTVGNENSNHGQAEVKGDVLICKITPD